MKKHYGRGGLGKVDPDDGGDIASDYYEAGYVAGIKRANAIIVESTDKAAAYKRTRLVVRAYGREYRRTKGGR